MGEGDQDLHFEYISEKRKHFLHLCQLCQALHKCDGKEKHKHEHDADNKHENTTEPEAFV